MRNPFRKKEIRQTLEEVLISGSLPTDVLTKEQALNIPAVSACVNLIADTIASLPIFLYTENDGKVEQVKEDVRVNLLNDDTGDTLDGWQFKRALIESYLLEGGGYSYINRNRNIVKSLHYVDNIAITIQSNVDPINKKYEIHVNGFPFRDFEFIKVIRKSKDGVTGCGIIQENNKVLSMVYNSIVYEENMVKTGGSKKGFLKSSGRLSIEAVRELKNAWNSLYKNNTENVIVLNNGLEFQEASNTSVEMQLAQQKNQNSQDICKLFLVPPKILSGEASDEEYNNWVKICISPILTAVETALNKDLLLPSEKQAFYFAFDANSLLKGDIEKRYSAYEIGVKSGILQIDEVRFYENLPPLGLNFIKLGLQDVLFNVATGEIYTPNTNKSQNMNNPGANPEENPDSTPGEETTTIDMTKT